MVPIAATRSSASQPWTVWNAPNEETIAKPMPRKPVTTSVTIVAINASTTQLFMAVSRNGMALGTRSVRKIVRALASYDASSSRAAGSTLVKPRIV